MRSEHNHPNIEPPGLGRSTNEGRMEDLCRTGWFGGGFNLSRIYNGLNFNCFALSYFHFPSIPSQPFNSLLRNWKNPNSFIIGGMSNCPNIRDSKTVLIVIDPGIQRLKVKLHHKGIHERRTATITNL